MNVGIEQIFKEINVIVANIQQTQFHKIKYAASILSESLFAGGIIHVFGAGHSRAFGMEMCGRAGGLAPMKLIGLEDIAALDSEQSINLVELERDPQTAHRLLELHEIQKEDSIIIVSNSGINSAPVELAMECKRRGIAVITVTSMAHSSKMESRHPSGKKLCDITEIIIDNCCPYGDVLLDIPNLPVKTGSASSIAGAIIAQSLTVEIIAKYIDTGRIPPVFISANVSGGDEHNYSILEAYKHRRITY